MGMPKRVAAIDVSHWHSAYDAAYLRILRDLGCDIVGVSDRDERIARNRAERFGGTPFTDYRRMIEARRPEFVIALGRHCEMPETFLMGSMSITTTTYSIRVRLLTHI